MDFYRQSVGGHTPYWGPPTSTLNFCEEDYQFTPYIAEVFNTLTNVTYIALGVHGLVNNRRRAAQGLAPNLPYIALVILGIGSSLFHSTMKYEMQMVDESSMLLGTFLVFYRLLRLSPSLSPTLIAVGLAILWSIIVASQIITGDSTAQQIVFTSMIWFLWYQTFALISDTKLDAQMKRKMRRTAGLGIAFFCTGHICWILDFYVCSGLRSTREKLGMPWAALLELHGWWHILTGLGVYLFIVLVECLQFATRPEMLAYSPPWPAMVHIKSDPLLDAKACTAAEKKRI